MINFFASWCPPCKVEHPFLLELSKEFSIYGIAKKDNFIDINKWLEKRKSICKDWARSRWT